MRRCAPTRERIAAYMIKAAREAKSRTSWSDRSQDYEDALTQFVHALLEPRDGNLFLNDIKAVQGRIARFGILNSLVADAVQAHRTRRARHLPGQRTTRFLARRSRQPARRRLRAAHCACWPSLEAARRAANPPSAHALLENLEDGRAKLYVTWRALGSARPHAALFERGRLSAGARLSGAHASHVCAYARRAASNAALVIVPRLYARLMGAARRVAARRRGLGRTRQIELPRRLHRRQNCATSSPGASLRRARATADIGFWQPMRSPIFRCCSPRASPKRNSRAVAHGRQAAAGRA